MEMPPLNTEHHSPSLEKMRLSQISFERTSTNQRGTKTVQETQIPIQIHGHEFELYVELTKKTGHAISSRSYAFVIRHSDNGVVTPNILAEAIFLEHDDHVAVMCSVQKENSHPSLIGAGLLIYKKTLELIEDVARTSDKKLVHTVTMERSISKHEKPLSTERWLALFQPVLEEHGYTQLDERHWQKTFYNTSNS